MTEPERWRTAQLLVELCGAGADLQVVSRRRFGALRTLTHRPPPASYSFTSIRSRKIGRQIGSCVLLVCGILYAAYSYLIPRIEIEPGITGSYTDAYKTEFVFKNSGRFALHDVVTHCNVFAGGRKYTSEGDYIIDAARPPMAQGIDELLPGEIASRYCGGGQTAAPFPAVMEIGIAFGWPLSWWRVTYPVAHFLSFKGQDGQIHVEWLANR